MDCEKCPRNKPDSVPLYTHEDTVARMDVQNRRAWILNIILAVLLAASWLGFFIYESQFEDVTENYQTVAQKADGHGDNHFIGGDYIADTND